MTIRLQSLRLHDAWPVRCVRTARVGRVAALVALTLTSITSLAATPVRAQSDDQAVVGVATRFFDGMRARDTALMRSTVVPATMLVIPGGPTGIQQQMSVDQFVGGIGQGTGPGGDERMRDPKVQIDGPMASLWAYYTYTRGGETKIDHCGIDAFLFRKGPDGWKIFNIAGTMRTSGCTPISK
jgi:hypothetical protein